MFHEITTCEVCGNKNLSLILDLGIHPMCDDLVIIKDIRICKEYPIQILFCNKCVTAHQRFQIPKQSLFTKNYHYRSRHTDDVLYGMRELVESCETHFGDLSHKKILDIGCNDGTLLSIFREKKAKTYGIEPTDAFHDALKLGHIVVNDFFCERMAHEFVTLHGLCDIITFTNVFAHIENLAEIIKALKIVTHKKSVIIIENHYLGAVIDKFQFDTFYHEHPRTYSLTSFIYIAASLGLDIGYVDFPARYNGNIRIIYVPGEFQINPAFEKIYEQEQNFSQHLKEMADKIELWRNKTRAYLEYQVQTNGQLRAKAFPGRAAIPIKMLGLDVHMIKATYEKPQSCKIGHYIPGTRIPILSDDTFNFLEKKAPLLNLAWHIPNEIKLYMQNKGYTGPIINIISPKDLI